MKSELGELYIELFHNKYPPLQPINPFIILFIFQTLYTHNNFLCYIPSKKNCISPTKIFVFVFVFVCVLPPHILAAFVPSHCFLQCERPPSLHYISPHFIAFHYLACAFLVATNFDNKINYTMDVGIFLLNCQKTSSQRSVDAIATQ